MLSTIQDSEFDQNNSDTKGTFSEMYPECVIVSWDALILLLDAENIERRVQLDAEKN